MKLFRFIRDNSLVAVAAVLLTACGTQATESADPASTPPPTEPTAAPSVEPTGQPEKPQQPGGGAPALPAPTLPIGDTPDSSEVDQCVIAGWLGDSAVPEQVSILVKTIDIRPPGVFDRGGSGCDGDDTPACSGGFAFTSTEEKCAVAVKAKAERGRTADLSFTGVLRCPAGQDRICRDFLKKIKPKTITLRQPRGPVPSDESPPSSSR